MSPALRILAPGLLTTVQDFGRPGFQHLGIPVGGALDSTSLQAANILVGNPPGTAVLEVAYLGPTIVVEAHNVRLAVVGADAPIEILSDARAAEGRLIEGCRSIVLRRGEVMRIGALSKAVLYIAVEGGFDLPPVLGSCATYLRGSFGGWHGRALATGDRLPLRLWQASERIELCLEDFNLDAPPKFRAILGPQADYFSEVSIRTFFDSEYVVCGSDRMGMLLRGPRIEHQHGSDIISDATATGCIQIPGSGQPIVLLPDRQTTGGYPKIATIISADLPALGRLAIGAKISFESVTLEFAHHARRKYLEEIGKIPGKVRPLRRSDKGSAAGPEPRGCHHHDLTAQNDNP
jgi:biotin-dependent carboxylase-like uncharacterized protein